MGFGEPAAELPDPTKDTPPSACPRSDPDSTSDAGRAQKPEARAGSSIERMGEGVP